MQCNFDVIFPAHSYFKHNVKQSKHGVPPELNDDLLQGRFLASCPLTLPPWPGGESQPAGRGSHSLRGGSERGG